jgi:hypothetical protein
MVYFVRMGDNRSAWKFVVEEPHGKRILSRYGIDGRTSTD